MRHLKVETSLQQLVHSLRRQGAVGQEECGESLVGSQVFFHLEIYNGTKKLSIMQGEFNKAAHFISPRNVSS